MFAEQILYRPAISPVLCVCLNAIFVFSFSLSFWFYIYVCVMCGCLKRPEEEVEFPGAGVTNDCQHVCWELNLAHLEGQRVLFTWGAISAAFVWFA